MRKMYIWTHKIKLLLNYIIECFNQEIPKPHLFVNVPLRASLEANVMEISNTIISSLPQLDDFITQFYKFIVSKNVNIVTDSFGNLDICVPSDMPDTEHSYISKRIGILDRLITTKVVEIDGLINEGRSLENQILAKNPNYQSKILARVEEFKAIKNRYNHI